MNLFALPENQRELILAEFGADAQHWIDGFPDLVRRCVDRWQLRLSEAATGGLPVNVVYFGENPRGEPVILKVGYPHPEQATEMIALERYEGRACPRLIACDRELGAIVMERILPGSTFRASAATIARSRSIPDVLAELPYRCDAVPGLPTFDSWLVQAFSEFENKRKEAPSFVAHVTRAQTLYEDFRRRHPQNWLLHGDLHHENILLDSVRGWVAIDPKGVIGPRLMEYGRFLHNFMEDEVEGVSSVAEASIDELCEVLDERFRSVNEAHGIHASELSVIAYIDCTLSFCWTLNAGGNWQRDLNRLEAVRQMLP